MGNQVSDWWNATQPAAAPSTPIPARVEWGQNNRHYKRAYASLAFTSPSQFAIGEVCRMMRLKATDRISALFVSTSGASTAGAGDIGLYLPGTNLDGAVIDADEFVAAFALTTAANKTESLLTAGATAITRRGAPLWEIAGYASLAAAIAAGAAEMDLCITATTAVTVANEEVVIELEGSFS